MINRDVTADEVQRLESLVTYLEEQDSQSLLHKQVRDVTTASKIRGEWWPVSSISSRFVRPRSLAYRSPHTISSLWKSEFGLWFVRLYLFWAICDNKCGPFLAGVCGYYREEESVDTTASKIRGEWWPVSSISSRFVRPRSLAYRSPHTISSLWKSEFGLWFVRLYLFWAICDNKCGPFLAGVCGCWWFMPNLLRSEDIGQVHSLFTRILQVSITCDKNDWFVYISVSV